MCATRISDGSHSPYGLILLGNTGVGKSFIGNILLGRDVFKHECNASSVTHETEFQDYNIGQEKYAIFNIPGLIEDDPVAIDRNKTEIYRAFQLRPNSVVAFVFTGGSGGRILDADLVAFKAINDVYKFQSESLLLIVNDLPLSRPPQYEGQTSIKLEHLLEIQHANICFLDRIDNKIPQEREQLRTKLMDAIIKCTPRVHEKHGDIKLTADIIQELKLEAKRRQKEVDETLANLKKEIALRDREINDNNNQLQQQPREIHHYHEKVIERESGDSCVIL